MSTNRYYGKTETANRELPRSVQQYIEKWVKENSDKIQKNLIQKSKIYI